MEKCFERVIKESQAMYNIVGSTITKSNRVQQGSYNLPVKFFEYAESEKILIRDFDLDYSQKRKEKVTNYYAYVLNNDYEFKLGPGVLWLIGEEYNKFENKFFAFTSSTEDNKFQIKRAAYSKRENQEYEWFVKLYDKNLAENKLILNIDTDNKIFAFDVKFNSIIPSASIEEDSDMQISIDDNINYSHNKIFFGAPGTGKSFQLNCEKKSLLSYNENENIDNYYERVTFHPDYSYANFVGTYKPIVEETNSDENQITYEYVPGPFLRTLVKALNNSSEIYLLIIEEVNRANVYSVFGDIFQLLDRNKSDTSMYPIDASEDMKKYLNEKTSKNYDKISIPANMFIWATMNSADQGVFPIDTAFKRRWDFTYMSINNNEEEIEDIMLKVAGKTYEWNIVRRGINDFLLENNINEDKLMGPFFVQQDSMNDFKESFKYKVLMYLYEDAARSIRPKLFSGSNGMSYSEICDDFESNGIGIFNEVIINNITEYNEENEKDED